MKVKLQKGKALSACKHTGVCADIIMKYSIHGKIKEKILSLPNGHIITVSDFEKFGKPKTISKSLERMVKKRCLEKVYPGIFRIPSENPALDPIELARAFARKNDWNIAPCGETALHVLGFSLNKTPNWTFVTNDKSTEYSFPGFSLSFKHTSNKFLFGMSDRTKLLVQSIKAYGKNCSKEKLKEYVASIRNFDSEKIIEESKNVTKWIYDYLHYLFDCNKEKKI